TQRETAGPWILPPSRALDNPYKSIQWKDRLLRIFPLFAEADPSFEHTSTDFYKFTRPPSSFVYKKNHLMMNGPPPEARSFQEKLELDLEKSVPSIIVTLCHTSNK
uniref:hypothetical protein n=1 Tax=Atopococcus tabaci TaxID=269774 RepID=UPI002409CCE4